jgi:hypothetical protein
MNPAQKAINDWLMGGGGTSTRSGGRQTAAGQGGGRGTGRGGEYPSREYQETPMRATGPNPEAMNPQYWERHREAVDYNMGLLENNPWLNVGVDLSRGSLQRNVSDMTPQETLRYSRLADALNNRYYRGLEQLRSGVALRGGQYSGSTAQLGERYQMPIETEEMRQMQRTRGYEQATRMAEIARQQATMGVPLEQTRARLEMQLKESGNLSDSQIKQIMDIFDYQLNYDRVAQQMAFARHYAQFTGFLQGVHIPQAQGNIIARQSVADPLLAAAFSNITGGGLTASQEQAIYFNDVARRLEGVTDARQQQQVMYSSLIELGAEGLAQVGRIAPSEARAIVNAAQEGLRELTGR